MPRPRFNRIDPARQEAILTAAAREFAEVGYEGASVNRVLEAVGLSKGAFYYYFDDKADLACAVLLWAYRDLLALYERIEIPEDAAKFWDVIQEFTHESLALLERAPYSTQLVARMGHAFTSDKALAARMLEVVARPTTTLLAIWKRGQELGAVRSDLPGETLISVMQGIKEALIRTYLPGGRVPTAEELERLTDLQLDFFRRVSVPAPGEHR